MQAVKMSLGVRRCGGDWRRLVLWFCLTGLAAARLPAADERITYAPDVVGVDRIFMIALKVPVGTSDVAVAVAVPEDVAMFDQTRGPAQTEVRRFYFRALKPAAKAEIRFSLPGGDAVVPVEIWSFDDLRQFRTLKGVQLPRRWPLGAPLPELKEKQTYPTGAEAKSPTGKARGGWLDRSDDEIWAMQPDSTIPRWHWTNIQYGCPVHGTEIYRKAPYYPWIMDSSLPWRWKIRCPVGGEEYPSNDFANGDMTSGPFPDDGIGGGCLHEGKKYGFIAELSQFYCRRMMTVAPGCARGYVSTGDVKYVHKALVALCRLAAEYAYLGTMTQHRHRNRVSQVERFGQGRFDEGPCLGSSGFTTYCIEQPGNLVEHAEAYDQIFPAIGKDDQIIPFLQAKGFDIKTHEDVRRFIEENLFAVWMQGVMDNACASNEPAEQRALAYAATVLNYARGADFIDWLYDGDGKMRSFVTNGYFRDGAPFESTGGYNGAHVKYMAPVVDDMEVLRQLRPEVYPESKYPSLGKSRRYHNIFDFCTDTVTIDRSLPYIGDGGSWPNYSKLSQKITWHDADAASFEHAYRLFRDPKFAWALVHSPGWKPSSDFPLTLAETQQEAARWADDWNDRSSLHDGYGVAILRSGTGDQKRALWMKYGQARGHTQDDLLDIGLQGYEGILLSHMGYPRNWGYWEHSWTSHHVARQIPFQSMSAQAELFAEAGPVRIAEARAQRYVDRVEQGQGYELPPPDWQRRTIALVDVAPDRFYCLDLYRISGGEEHWWSFHAQEGEFATEGLDLAKQEGTLAGPDVPYGDAAWLKAHGCSYGVYGWAGPMFAFPHLYNVQRGKPDGVWSADWKLKTGDGLHLRLTVAGAPGTEVNICDGRSPAGGSPYEMKWIMLHAKDSPPVKTQVLSVLEPYVNEPAIRGVRPLAISGPDEQGFAAAGCEVQLADRTDTLLVSADPSVARTAAGSFRFAGRFGFFSERDGVPAAISLVGGTQLAKGDFGITLDSPEYRAKIVAVDRDTETITVAPPRHDVAALVGADVFISNSDRRIACRVLEAKAAGGTAQLRLNYDSRIGTGRCSGAADFRVLTSTPMPLQRFRYYHGARLTNAERNVEYRIVDVRSGSAVFLDAKAHGDATAAKLAGQFPKESWFDIYDYGVGDELVWPYAASVTLVSPGRYRVTAPVPVQVRLPDGAKTEGDAAAN